MTTSSDNTINNEWIQWIEDGIAGEYINYHDYNEFHNMKRIGTGGFGEVYRANLESSNTVVALKSLTNGNYNMKEIVNEIRLMRKVNLHTNIIQFFGITKKKNNVYSDYLFVLEYADSGTLRDYLKNNFDKLDWDIKLRFAIQITDAVSCIHHKNIVHRDLHSNNILVHKNNIKLADFDGKREIPVAGTPDEYVKIYTTNEQKPWNNTNAINNDYNNSSNSSSSSYSTINSLLCSSLDCLLEIEDEKSKATTTTVVRSRSSKNTLLRNFLKDHKKNLERT
ncbi:unnamed protein product [Rhizophagus irregularis]|nr:unnamed protein product [Rhizophagus irregularis]